MVLRIGTDENGLGSRLGPMIVTAVLADATPSGERLLSRKLPARLRRDLDDSKRLVSHNNIALGEAWSRAVVGPDAKNPSELFDALSFEGKTELTNRCPRHIKKQCWGVQAQSFQADDELVDRVVGHVEYLSARGIQLRRATSSVLCAKRLNDERADGENRFTSDLHAMERMIISMREDSDEDVLAICGKVGGIGDYSKFFGPLSERLHSVLKQERAESIYHFPGLGEIRFLRDADAADPLVMLASLIGKYVRELLMSQITGFYQARVPSAPNASGYHDPVTAKFVQLTKKQRKDLRISDDCFERFGPKNSSQKVTKAPRRAKSAATPQPATLPGLRSPHK